MFPDLPHVIDAVVRGPIDLHHIDVVPRGDARAIPAGAARVRRGRLNRKAIQGLGQDPRRRCLADTPRPDKQEGMPDPAGTNRILQRSGNVLLPDDVFEGLGTPLPGQDQIGILRHDKKGPRLIPG